MPKPANGTRRRKKGGDGASTNSGSNSGNSSRPHEHTDSFHNRLCYPSCRLLQDIAKQVWPLDTTDDKSTNPTAAKEYDSGTFSFLLRQHLIQDQKLRLQQQQQQQQHPSTSAAKKKRKKKKKKKSETSSAPLLVAETDERSETNTDSTEIAQPGETPESLPPPPVQQSALSLGGITTTSTTTSAASRPPPLTLRARRDFLLQEFILRTAKKVNAPHETTRTNSSKSSTTTATATEEISNFLQHYLALPNQPPCRVAHEAVQLAVQSITCEPCRRSIHDVLRQEECLPLLTLLLAENSDNYSSSNNGHFHNSNSHHHHHHHTTTAFDYVAMEEGNAGPPTPHKDYTGWYFLKVSSSSSSNPTWELRYQDSVVENATGNDSSMASGNGNNKDSVSPWTMESFNLWLRHGVILGGTDADLLLNTLASPMITTSVRASLGDTVDSECAESTRQFAEMNSELSEAEVTFDNDTRDHAAGGNIEMSTFKIMRDTDNICGGLLRKLLSVVVKTSRAAEQILLRYAVQEGLLNDNDNVTSGAKLAVLSRQEMEAQFDWLFDLIDDVWRGYCDGLQQIVNEICAYEKQVFELANAQGRIPEMFCSATSRSLYRALVERKIAITYRAINAVEDALNAPVDILYPLGSSEGGWYISFTRFLSAERAFQQVMGVEGCNGAGDVAPPLDAALQEALNETLLWTATVHQPTVQKIVDVHVERREELFQMLQKVQSELQRKSGAKNSYIDDLLEQIRAFQETPPSENGEDVTEETKLSFLRANLGRGMLRAISPSVRYKLEEPSQETRPPLGMPLCLRRVMALGSNGQTETSECSGGDGHVRVGCIFTGFLYRWVEARFMEWQALKAEQELLTTILQDDGEKETKSTKKSKKKKNSNKKPQEMASGVDERQDLHAQKTELKSSSPEKRETKPNESKRASMKAETGKDGPERTEPDAFAEKTMRGVASPPGLGQIREPSTAPTSAENAQEASSEDGALLLEQENESLATADLNIGVVDGLGSFQTAESFLVGRLEQVLKTDGVAIL